MKKKLLCLLLAITVTLAVAPVIAVNATTTGFLDDISFGTALAAVNKGNISLNEAFSADKHEYTVYVKDSQATLYAWATLSTAGKGKTVKCNYTKTNGSAASITVQSAKSAGTTLTSSVAKGFSGNTLTFVVGEQTYTVNIVRVASLSTLTLKNGDEEVSLNTKFAPATDKYSANTFYGANLKVEAAATSAGTEIKVNGNPISSQKSLSWNSKTKSTNIEVSVYKSGEENTTKSIYTISVTAPALDGIEGLGTKESPFLIASGNDMKTLGDAVSGGITFKGFYFKLKKDITLPSPWTPIGTSTTSYPFSGDFNGDGHLITVPKSEKAPFGVTVEAYLHNFSVYGEEINGTAIVDTYTTGAAGKTCVTIENVTLKSGSKTLKSGFIGGYSHGNAPIYIKNCKVESNVIIGYGKNETWIGSFGGEFNGVVEDCVSYATLYGTDFVGGIVADKGQTMGDCKAINCEFGGKIVSSGNYVGGIIGHGYGGTTWGWSSAGNAPIVSITGCKVNGDIEGKNYVGGILGGDLCVYQCWDNGIGNIENNEFTGTVKATQKDAYIGAIIGYMVSLNANTVIKNNTFLKGCGTDKGIGGIQYIDTNYENPTAANGVTYYNTQKGNPNMPGVSRYAPNFSYWRTDDPLGADIEKLFKAVEKKEDKEQPQTDKKEDGNRPQRSPNTHDNSGVLVFIMLVCALGTAMTLRKELK